MTTVLGRVGVATILLWATTAEAQPINDDCASAITISDGNTAFDTSGAATDGPNVPSGVGDCNDFGNPSIYNDIWFNYVAPCTGTLQVRTCGAADFDTKLGVYDGCDCGNLTILGCNDDGLNCPGHTSFLQIPVTQSNCYKIRIGGFDRTVAGPGEVNVQCIEQLPDNPVEVGRWLPPQFWPVIGIHAAVLPTGKVLHYSYPFGTPGSLAKVWDPETGFFEDVSMSIDIFCGGISFLPNGSLFVTGGNDAGCIFPPEDFRPRGRLVTNVFDPFSGNWTPSADLAVGRWYPTNVTLGDGRVMIFSGLDHNCERTPVVEVFTLGIGMQVVPEAERFMDLFPRMHLLTSGKIAHVGQGADTYTYDPSAGIWKYVDTGFFGSRYEGTSVLLPGDTDTVMIIGGYEVVGEHIVGVKDSCERIDFSQPFPQWQPLTPMNFGRANANAVILPDKTVLIVGGGMEGLYGEHRPELYDPVTDTWTVLPPQVYERMYHSTAVLLPDGRVLSAGQDRGPSGFWGEVYEPAYLFRGPRPTIVAAPPRIAYGLPFSIVTPQATQIGSVALVRHSAVTHSFNTEQRFVELGFQSIDSNELRVTGLPNQANAPVGYYMMFILNTQGVPSVAHMVQLCAPSCPQPDLDDILCVLDGFGVGSDWATVCPLGDLDPCVTGDGDIDLDDILKVIDAFGGNPACPDPCTCP